MNTKTTEIPRTTSSHVQEPPSQSSLPPSKSTTLSQVLKSSPPPTPTPAFTYSYSNTFAMRRHDYSPVSLSSEEPNSRDMFSNYNNDTSPPLFNDPHLSHSDRNMVYHFSSASSSPLVPTSVILPDEPSRPSLYSVDTPVVGLEPSPATIHHNIFTPRGLGSGPSIMPHQLDHHHNQHQHRQHLYHQTHFLQQAPPPQPTNSYPSYLRHLMNDSDSPNTTSAIPGGPNPTEAELRSLQRRVRELEEELEKRTKLRDLIGVFPPDWDERTKFREQKYCSLNRAGNALCAWHDSRRERRLFAPRMAPHRTLNCGCTYEEAIFEESLSRNGVGSFWPGESVRMDPMLRNRLLGVLQRVYRYKDGDFERNPDGTWKEGQSAAAWEERARRPVRRERS